MRGRVDTLPRRADTEQCVARGSTVGASCPRHDDPDTIPTARPLDNDHHQVRTPPRPTVTESTPMRDPRGGDHHRRSTAPIDACGGGESRHLLHGPAPGATTFVDQSSRAATYPTAVARRRAPALVARRTDPPMLRSRTALDATAPGTSTSRTISTSLTPRWRHRIQLVAIRHGAMATWSMGSGGHDPRRHRTR